MTSELATVTDAEAIDMLNEDPSLSVITMLLADVFFLTERSNCTNKLVVYEGTRPLPLAGVNCGVRKMAVIQQLKKKSKGRLLAKHVSS